MKVVLGCFLGPLRNKLSTKLCKREDTLLSNFLETGIVEKLKRDI